MTQSITSKAPATYGLYIGFGQGAPPRAIAARRHGVDQHLSRARAHMPFGGYKSSGIGRENGIEAVRDFTRTKSVWVETEPVAGDPFTIKL